MALPAAITSTLRLSADIFERMCRKAAELVTPDCDLGASAEALKTSSASWASIKASSA